MAKSCNTAKPDKVFGTGIYFFFLILQERFDERQKSADDRHLFLASLTDRKGLRRQVGT